MALCLLHTSAETERQNIDSLVLPFVTGLIDWLIGWVWMEYHSVGSIVCESIYSSGAYFFTLSGLDSVGFGFVGVDALAFVSTYRIRYYT